jgi:hypothetical protein
LREDFGWLGDRLVPIDLSDPPADNHDVSGGIDYGWLGDTLVPIDLSDRPTDDLEPVRTFPPGCWVGHRYYMPRISGGAGPARATNVQVVAEVLTDPSRLAHLPLDALVDLRRQLWALESDVESAILTRTLAQHHAAPMPDRAVRIEEAGTMLGMTTDYLYRHWKKLGGYRDDDGHIKFALSTIQGHIQRAFHPQITR